MINAVVLGSTGVLKPGPLLWLRASLWGLLLFAIILVVPSLIQALGIALSTNIDPMNVDPMFVFNAPANVLLVWTIAAVLAGVGLYAGLVVLAEKRSLTELALRPALIEIVAGLAAGALMIAVAVGLMWLAGAITIAPRPMSDPTRALALTLQSGVVEEIAFRLVAFRLLWRAFGLGIALLLSAFLFGALHLFNPNASWFAAIAIAVEAGIMLAGFYILTGRIWMAMGVHAGWNFTQGWVFGAPVSGTSAFDGGPFDVEPVPGIPDVLSGGGFGPEASFAGLIVGIAVGVLTLWMAWKRGRLGGAVSDQAEA